MKASSQALFFGIQHDDEETPEDLTGADRGDEVASLEETLLAEQNPEPKAEEPPSETVAEAPAEPETSEEKAEEPEQDAKKSVYIPKSRFDEVNNQRKYAESRIKELEAQLNAAKPVENSDLDALEESYAQALLDGEVAEARKIRQNIRQIEQRIFAANTAQIADQAKNLTRSEMEFEATVQRLETEYEPFDRSSPNFNQELVDETLELFDSFVKKGTNPAAAMEKAAKYVTTANGISPRTMLIASQKPPATVKPSTITSKLEAATKQPPVQQGQSNTSTEPNYATMSEEEFFALPKATRARLRGDIL